MNKIITLTVVMILMGGVLFALGRVYEQKLHPTITTTFRDGFERQTYPINGEVIFGTDGKDTVTIEIKGLIVP